MLVRCRFCNALECDFLLHVGQLDVSCKLDNSLAVELVETVLCL